MAKHSRTKSRVSRRHRYRAWALAAGIAVLLTAGAATPGALHQQPATFTAWSPPRANTPNFGTTRDSAVALPSPMTPGEQLQLGHLLMTPQCLLNIPANPLSAAGLSQPWFLENATATCAENAATGAFAQATILNPVTGQLSVYYPLVVPEGQTPAVPIIPVTLAPGDIVTVWTGFNGNQLKLAGPGAAFFVNFAQQSWANSPLFFQALRTAIQNGLVKVPPLGTANDGLPCPSTRDFSIVDQDQSDNVPSGEIVTAAGAVAQDTAINRADLPGATQLLNGSDQIVIDVVDQALGCAPWLVPNQTDPGVVSPSAALQEQQAATFQLPPIALVPGLDDFVTNNGMMPPMGRPDLFLQNLYRLQVGQPLTGNGNDTRRYCVNLALTGAPRLQLDFDTESMQPVPSFVAGTGLNAALALAHRFMGTWTMLNCTGLTGQPSPVTVTLVGNTAVAATFRPYRGPLFGVTPGAYSSGGS